MENAAILLQKFLFAAAIWLFVGLYGAVCYRKNARGALYILRGIGQFAFLTGVIGLILPRFCWPWAHILLPTVIFLIILTIVYVHNHPEKPDSSTTDEHR